MSIRLSRVVCSVVTLFLVFVSGSLAKAQQKGLVSCKPASERTGAEGCWIVASQKMEVLPLPLYWTLDVFPTKTAAESAKGSGMVVEALGKVWVMTVAPSHSVKVNSQGSRVTEIGPLTVQSGTYTAQYMEAILEPGAVSRTHTHSGPEAFYTESGESCLETPAAKQVGKKGVDIVVPEGVPMELVATGSETRRSIVLVLHDSSKPPTTVVEWKSKGLCMSGVAK
jgi:quercetin dioxygenase-like cupin family protein